jgi:hypothetical protein
MSEWVTNFYMLLGDPSEAAHDIDVLKSAAFFLLGDHEDWQPRALVDRALPRSLDTETAPAYANALWDELVNMMKSAPKIEITINGWGDRDWWGRMVR